MTLTTTSRRERSSHFERVLSLVEIFGGMVLALMGQPGDPLATNRDPPSSKDEHAHEGNGATAPTPGSIAEIEPEGRYAAKQVASLMQCSLAKIRKDTRHGGPLPTIRDGKRVYIMGSDLIKHMSARL